MFQLFWCRYSLCTQRRPWGREIGIAAHLYHQLSLELHQQIENITTSFHSLQIQIALQQSFQN